MAHKRFQTLEQGWQFPINQFTWGRSFSKFLEAADSWVILWVPQVRISPGFLANANKLPSPVSTREVVEPYEPLAFVKSNCLHTLQHVYLPELGTSSSDELQLSLSVKATRRGEM